MLRISGIKVSLDNDTNEYIGAQIRHMLHLSKNDKMSFTVCKKSVDARRKNDVHFVYSADVELEEAQDRVIARGLKNVKLIIPSTFEIRKVRRRADKRPVVCGFGPAGMFCALVLARAGMEPVIVERGSDVDRRTEDVEHFFDGGKLTIQSNVQFGEGGAGTFSDGKLTCGVNDRRMEFILSELVRFGADADILHAAKPHIGTDVLRRVVKNLRKEIIALGGEIHFNTRLCDIVMQNGKVSAAVCETADGESCFECDTLVLAIGHSARDTFDMIYGKGLEMEQKPFSIGVRIEHLQSMINRAQYGDFANHSALGAADYKLSCRMDDGRGVYTFCMCPGGSVVAASSEAGGVVTNGMSLHARDGKNANAALLCDVRPGDFGSEHPLAGVEFQRIWERAAYALGGNSYKAPVNLVGAFLDGKVAHDFGEVVPTYRPGVVFADLRECLPDFVSASLRAAIPIFDRRLSGFASRSAVLTGVETRSSSPVRIVRGQNFESGERGIFPCGEGAGYAGGIMSAALDGIKTACAIIERYQ